MEIKILILVTHVLHMDLMIILKKTVHKNKMKIK
jgi:hypothetical protein